MKKLFFSLLFVFCCNVVAMDVEETDVIEEQDNSIIARLNTLDLF